MNDAEVMFLYFILVPLSREVRIKILESVREHSEIHRTMVGFVL